MMRIRDAAVILGNHNHRLRSRPWGGGSARSSGQRESLLASIMQKGWATGERKRYRFLVKL